MEAQVLGAEARASAMEAQVLGVEAQVLGVEAQVLGVEAQALGVEAQAAAAGVSAAAGVQADLLRAMQAHPAPQGVIARAASAYRRVCATPPRPHPLFPSPPAW